MALYFEFNRKAYTQDLINAASKVLENVGFVVTRWMERFILEGSGSDFSTRKIRQPLANAVSHRIEEKTDEMVTEIVGLINSPSEFDYIRAAIIEHGTGSKNENGGEPIQHHSGKEAINSEVTHYVVSDAPDFMMPEKFNMNPEHWFSDTMQLVDTLFDEEIEAMIRNIDLNKYLELKGDVTISL